MEKALHLIPDSPISSPSFDRLDRMAFVRSFALAIRAVEGNDSVVLALAGPWGSGKSSLINLIAGELEDTPGENPPLVIRFNPWWFTGTERLVAAFLQQLGVAVSRPEVKPILGEATIALERLADAIARPGEQDPTTDPATRDIETLRRRIDTIFTQSDRRILIFMDDIDRLTPEEMTQLLLIVRAVANFPHTTFVLALDYEVVCEAIGDKLGVDGRTYLEKVVQLQIDVPIPGQMTLERMVIGQLQAIDPSAKSLDAESQVYLRNLFERGIKHFLQTPRACTRLLNVLRFTYPTLKGQVYFPDMLGLACLMSFSSQAIQAMRTNSHAFAGHCESSGDVWSRVRMYHSHWLNEISARDRNAVEEIVRLMFPKVNWALNGPVRGEEYVEEWQKQMRICSVRHFDSYFRLGLTASEAAEYEWQNMIELLDDATAFAQASARFGPLAEESGSGWIGDLLKQAADFVHERAAPEQARRLFRALAKRGDQIAGIHEDELDDFFEIDPIHGAVSILLDCLIRIENPHERYQVLVASVSEDAGLLTTLELINLLRHRIDIFADQDQAQSTQQDREKLRRVLKILDDRIRKASETGELLDHPHFVKIVLKWRRFRRKSRSRRLVRVQCRSDQKLVDALMQICWGADFDEETLEDQPAAVPIDLIVELFDPNELVASIQEILIESPEWLTPQRERTLEMVVKLVGEASVEGAQN